MERLQRVIASHGIASRRKAEEMILEGRVTVDGDVVRELGSRVDPERQQIRVDGRLLKPERRRYLMLNKPDGYITTAQDERGRRTVLDLVKVPERVVPVGRLDRHTSGLLLLTNDGELLFRITHPRFELEKEYEVLVDGHPPPAALERLRSGVIVDGAKVVPSQVRPLRNEEAGTVLRIVIHEGRNRIVRRMLERIGYPVIQLFRTRVGPIQVRGLALGEWRDLTGGELSQLRDAVGLGDEDTERPPERRAVPPSARGPRRGFDGPRGQRAGRERTGERSGQRQHDRRGTNQPGQAGSRRGDRRAGGGREEHRGERRRPKD